MEAILFYAVALSGIACWPVCEHAFASLHDVMLGHRDSLLSRRDTSSLFSLSNLMVVDSKCMKSRFARVCAISAVESMEVGIYGHFTHVVKYI